MVTLEQVRLDRPGQVINEVISSKENEFGFYDVLVDMEVQFFETKIRHVRIVIPYPLSAYTSQQNKWGLK